MAIIQQEEPKIISILFQQEKSDADYGSCLWARFYLDLKNYTLSVKSDCGNYDCSWPITESESFLHLISRIDADYLLRKISSESVVNSAATWKSLQELINDVLSAEIDSSHDINCLSETDRDDLEAACYNYNHSLDETANAIKNAILDINTLANLSAIKSPILDTEILANIDDYSIYTCIEMDYPNNAKKIVEIFENHIQPYIKTMK